MIPFIVTHSGDISLHVNNRSYSVAKTHPNYDAIKSGLKNDQSTDQIMALVDGIRAVKNFVNETDTTGTVTVKKGMVYYKGKQLHNAVTQKIIELMQQGYPFHPMIRFLENLMENPSLRAVTELYDFLSHRGLPITDDGCFLAYKAVRDDYLDKYSGKFDNTPGKVVEVIRNSVDDDRAHECSYGLHVGALSYVDWYGGAGAKKIVVKVNPRDCVAVPRDHNATKLRVCRYEVLHDFDGKQLEKAMYSDKGTDYDPKELRHRFRTKFSKWNRDRLVKAVLRKKLVSTVTEGRELKKNGCVDLLVEDAIKKIG